MVEGWETLIPPLFKASARYACAVTHGELKLLLAEFGLYHFDAVLGGLAKPGGGTDGVGAWRYRRYGRGLGARGCLQCCRGTRAQPCHGVATRHPDPSPCPRPSRPIEVGHLVLSHC